MRGWQYIALLLAGAGASVHAQTPVCDPATVAAQHLTRLVATDIPWSVQQQTAFAGYHYLDLTAGQDWCDLPAGMPVLLVVHDATGREVARLADGWYPPGRHRVRLAATGWPAGVYLATLTTAAGRRTVQLVHVP
jgi:hypothetical protein